MAHQLWGEMAREVRSTDVAAAESRGDTSLRVCMAKLRVSKDREFGISTAMQAWRYI